MDDALAGVKPHLMVTDPPYGVAYDADWRTTKRNKDGSLLSTGTGRAKGAVSNDDRADWREAWGLFPGTVAYVWHSGLHAGVVAEILVACKFALRAQIVWVKQIPVVGRGDYHWQHEAALYAVAEGADDQWGFVPEHEIAAYSVRAGSPGQYRGGFKQSTVWNIEHVKSETGHSTQKPVECMRRPIENNSKPGDRVYDPFVGSGTTIIAAEMTGRLCHAIELSPHYVDVAVRRWQAFTGKQGVHASTGVTFGACEAARAARAA